MARRKYAEPALSAEQQGEAELIYQRIRGAFDEEARRLAQLMASKETRQLFGETEYQVRDRVHALGAEVLEAAAEERSGFSPELSSSSVHLGLLARQGISRRIRQDPVWRRK